VLWNEVEAGRSNRRGINEGLVGRSNCPEANVAGRSHRTSTDEGWREDLTTGTWTRGDGEVPLCQRKGEPVVHAQTRAGGEIPLHTHR
jgi:ribosome modulation factor